MEFIEYVTYLYNLQIDISSLFNNLRSCIHFIELSSELTSNNYNEKYTREHECERSIEDINWENYIENANGNIQCHYMEIP